MSRKKARVAGVDLSAANVTPERMRALYAMLDALCAKKGAR